MAADKQTVLYLFSDSRCKSGTVTVMKWATEENRNRDRVLTIIGVLLCCTYFFSRTGGCKSRGTLEKLLLKDAATRRAVRLSSEETRRFAGLLSESGKLLAEHEARTSQFNLRCRAFNELEQYFVACVQKGTVSQDVQDLWAKCASAQFVAPPGEPEGVGWGQGKNYFDHLQHQVAAGSLTVGDLEDVQAAVDYFSDFKAELAVRNECLNRILRLIKNGADERLADTVYPCGRCTYSNQTFAEYLVRYDPFEGHEPEELFVNCHSVDPHGARFACISGGQRSYGEPDDFISNSIRNLPFPIVKRIGDKWVALIRMKEGQSAVFSLKYEVPRIAVTFVVYGESKGDKVTVKKVGGGSRAVSQPLTLEDGRYYFSSTAHESSLMLLEEGATPEVLVDGLERKQNSK